MVSEWCVDASLGIKWVVKGEPWRKKARKFLRDSIAAGMALIAPPLFEYSPDTDDHLRVLTTRQQAIVLDTVDEQLIYQPTVETKNRKLMRPNPVAPWELRIGNLRIYYDVEDAPEPVVHIRAVGVKERNRVRIGGEVIEL